MQNNKITILWGATGILEGTIKKLWGFQSNFFIDIKLKKFPKLYGPKYVKNISGLCLQIKLLQNPETPLLPPLGYMQFYGMHTYFLWVCSLNANSGLFEISGFSH